MIDVGLRFSVSLSYQHVPVHWQLNIILHAFNITYVIQGLIRYYLLAVKTDGLVQEWTNFIT